MGFRAAVKACCRELQILLEEQAAGAVVVGCGCGLGSRPSLVRPDDAATLLSLLATGRVQQAVAWFPSQWESSVPAGLAQRILNKDGAVEARQGTKVREAHLSVVSLAMTNLVARACDAHVDAMVCVCVCPTMGPSARAS